MEQDEKEENSELELAKKRRDPEQEEITDTQSEVEVANNKENKRSLPVNQNDKKVLEDGILESTKPESHTDDVDKKTTHSKISSISSKLKRKNKKLKQKLQFKDSDLKVKNNGNEPSSTSTSTKVRMSSSDHLSDTSNIPPTVSQTDSKESKFNNERDETKRSNTSLFSKIKVPKVPVEKLKKLGKIKRKSNKGSVITETDINENDTGNNTFEEETYDSDEFSDSYEENVEPVCYDPSDIEHVTNASTYVSNAENDDNKQVKKVKRKRNKKSRDSRLLPEDVEVISSQEVSAKREKRMPSQSKDESEEMSTEADKMTWEKEFDETQLFGITIHGSEYLQSDLKLLSHPIVRISLVDPVKGTYIKNSNEDSKLDYIPPILTKPFNFKEKRSFIPRWEETLIVDQPIKKVLKIQETNQNSDHLDDYGPVMFFLIRDFYSMEKTREDKRSKEERGWYNCAWAFLKLLGANNETNINKRCRLQLFKPPSTKKHYLHKEQVEKSAQTPAESSLDPVFNWWKNKTDFSGGYKSTLFVTIKSIDINHPLAVSQLAKSDENQVRLSELELVSKPLEGRNTVEEMRKNVKWTKKPGQSSKIPNNEMLQLWAGNHGAFTIKFSNNGYFLAAACRHGQTFPVLIYNIPYGELIGELCGHQQIVYDFDWSKNDELLLSASGDGTAQVWSLSSPNEPAYTLSHPAYVYAAKFHPQGQHIIVTAGFDKMVRVWSIAKSKSRLLQELEGHTHHINSIAFDIGGITLYSADSGGNIICWSSVTSEYASQEHKINWCFKKKIEDKLLKGFSINSIEVNSKNDKKLLLNCKNTNSKMYDSRIKGMLAFQGVMSDGQLIRTTATSCGTFVLAGNQNGRVYVWNAETGDQVATYDDLPYTNAVNDVCWHKHDNIVAFCSLHPNSPIILYNYNTRVASNGVKLGGFHIKTSEDISLEDMYKPTTDEENTAFKQLDESLVSHSKLDVVKRQLDTIVLGPSGQASMKSTFKQVTMMTSAVKAFENSLKQGSSTFNSMKSARSLLRDEPMLSTYDNDVKLQPAYLSPHATTQAKMHSKKFEHHINMTTKSARENNDDWKPSFTSIGNKINTSLQSTGKNNSMLTSLSFSNKFAESQETKGHNYVLVLYDYQAHRSDELTIKRNDVIKLLFKDGTKWWFGENSSRCQGYFPASYVTTTDEKQDFEEPEVVPRVDKNVLNKSDPLIEEFLVKPVVKSEEEKPLTTEDLSTSHKLPVENDMTNSLSASRGRRRVKRTQQKPDELNTSTDDVIKPGEGDTMRKIPLKSRPLPPLSSPVTTDLSEEKLRRRRKKLKKKSADHSRKNMKDPSPNSRRRRHRSPSHSDVTSKKSPASQRKSKSPPKQMRLSRGSKKEGGKIAAAEEEKFGVLKAIQEKIRNSQFDDDDQCDVTFQPVTSSTMIKNDDASTS